MSAHFGQVGKLVLVQKPAVLGKLSKEEHVGKEFLRQEKIRSQEKVWSQEILRRQCKTAKLNLALVYQNEQFIVTLKNVRHNGRHGKSVQNAVTEEPNRKFEK